MLPSLLIAASVSIVGLMGLVHLLLTYWSPKLRPREESLVAAMKSVNPVITKQTTIWNMWIGFNASHSMGALLLGITYSYLSLAHPEVFFESVLLQAVGLATLASFALLARLYWFVTPLAGSALSLVLYVTGLALARAQ